MTREEVEAIILDANQRTTDAKAAVQNAMTATNEAGTAEAGLGHTSVWQYYSAAADLLESMASALATAEAQGSEAIANVQQTGQ
jgi:hypothetical protein